MRERLEVLAAIGRHDRARNETGELSDREAIARAREGDHAGFRVLVERYQARAYRVAVRVLRNDEQARDAVQEAFLKVYTSLRRFEGRSSFYTWLYRLVVNVCLDMRRRDRSDQHVEWDEGRSLETTDGAEAGYASAAAWDPAGPVGEFERSELRSALAAAIATLPHGQREALILREVDGLSYAEIAEALGISKGTVMSRLHYARRKVQRELIASGSVDAPQPQASRAAGENQAWGCEP
ncbi:MAG: sigma-70 family RNA polymerase sigma factor [Deltaproteobacteria bacterium]|nr:MAG: sigma-70 family RNA polymerase sigma factor [Deltaproteobacteria bacterium]